jgi:hypothetical protein
MSFLYQFKMMIHTQFVDIVVQCMSYLINTNHKGAINLIPLHTRAKSYDHEIVREQKKSVQRPSQDTSKPM